jgi:peptidoglycan hydrolase CwlO-like protein
LKKRSLITLSLAAALTIGTLPTWGGTANAESLSDLKEKKESISSEKKEVNEKISTKESEINENISTQKDIKSEIAAIDTKTRDTEKKLQEKSVKITETTAEVEKLKKDIAALKKKIEERNELLEERARAIQEKGGSASYIDVLLGAESFGDFLNRITAVNTIVSADKKIMDEQKRDKESLESKQKEVEEKLASLKEAKAELESLKQELESQKAQKAELFKQLKKQQETLEVEKDELESHASELEEIEAQIGGEIQAEQARLQEIARQKEREAKAQRQQQQASNSGGGGGSSVAATPVSAGTWTRPASGIITTEYGWDVLNGQSRYHWGTDIAANGNVPIVAAADGIVLKSHYSSSYGNVVYMTHSINGQTFTTVYAHMSSSMVNTGDYVKKGQRIGTMGSTGFSTGQHLHFELHEGAWNAAKSNSVNPRKYVSL